MNDLLQPDWFAGDHHFGHENILKFEPDARGHYSSVSHMNHDIVARHNMLVAPDDIVLFVGDLVMGREFEKNLELIELMNGKKYLRPGNHDRVHPIMTKNEERRAGFQELYEAVGLTVLPLHGEVLVGDHLVNTSHYPYLGTVDGGLIEHDKHNKWRPAASHQPLVHGHIHIQRVTKDNMYNVGIGLRNLEPTPASAIADWLQTL